MRQEAKSISDVFGFSISSLLLFPKYEIRSNFKAHHVNYLVQKLPLRGGKLAFHSSEPNEIKPPLFCIYARIVIFKQLGILNTEKKIKKPPSPQLPRVQISSNFRGDNGAAFELHQGAKEKVT